MVPFSAPVAKQLSLSENLGAHPTYTCECLCIVSMTSCNFQRLSVYHMYHPATVAMENDPLIAVSTSKHNIDRGSCLMTPEGKVAISIESSISVPSHQGKHVSTSMVWPPCIRLAAAKEVMVALCGTNMANWKIFYKSGVLM